MWERSSNLLDQPRYRYVLLARIDCNYFLLGSGADRFFGKRTELELVGGAHVVGVWQCLHGTCHSHRFPGSLHEEKTIWLHLPSPLASPPPLRSSSLFPRALACQLGTLSDQDPCLESRQPDQQSVAEFLLHRCSYYSLLVIPRNKEGRGAATCKPFVAIEAQIGPPGRPQPGFDISDVMMHKNFSCSSGWDGLGIRVEVKLYITEIH